MGVVERKGGALKRDGRYSVRQMWGHRKGEDAFVVGTGTSLAGFDFSQLAGRVTIALNDAVRCPGLEPLYHLFSDTGIWRRYSALALHERTTVICSEHAAWGLLKDPACKFKNRVAIFSTSGIARVSPNDDHLYVDRTVATAGVELAWKLGCRRVFLMGVDGYKLPEAYYWDGRKKEGPDRRPQRTVDGRVIQDRHNFWAENMRALKKFFKEEKVFAGPFPASGIYNLSRWSTIDAWEKVGWQTVVEQLALEKKEVDGERREAGEPL